MLLWRRIHKRIARLVLYGFLFSVSASWANDCLLELPAQANGNLASSSVNSSVSDALGQSGHDDDEHCPPLPDELTDGRGHLDAHETAILLVLVVDPSIDLSVAYKITATVFPPVARPRFIPAYPAVHWLRV